MRCNDGPYQIEDTMSGTTQYPGVTTDTYFFHPPQTPGYGENPNPSPCKKSSTEELERYVP